MIQEKSFIDEKRARLDLAQKLSALMNSRPPSGPSSFEAPSSPDIRTDGDELSQIKQSLSNVS